MKNYLKLAEAFSRWENGEVPLFNGDISGWSGDSSGWDVDSVTSMSGMFAGATDLSRRENDMSEKALDESIAHWERLRDAVEKGDWEGVMSEGWHARECALCSEIAIPVVYVQSGHGRVASTRFQNGCKGCQVREKTGRKECLDTPYRQASERLYRWGSKGSSQELAKIREQYRMKALDAVNEELEFLRSLRRTNNG